MDSYEDVHQPSLHQFHRVNVPYYVASISMFQIGEDFSECFPTYVRTGKAKCLLSLAMLNLFLGNIMAQSLIEMESLLVISGLTINDLGYVAAAINRLTCLI